MNDKKYSVEDVRAILSMLLVVYGDKKFSSVQASYIKHALFGVFNPRYALFLNWLLTNGYFKEEEAIAAYNAYTLAEKAREFLNEDG